MWCLAHWRKLPLKPILSAIYCTSCGTPTPPGSPLGRGNHSLVTLRFKYVRLRDLPSKTMKRPNSTSLRRHAGNMKARNVRKGT